MHKRLRRSALKWENASKVNKNNQECLRSQKPEFLTKITKKLIACTLNVQPTLRSKNSHALISQQKYNSNYYKIS